MNKVQLDQKFMAALVAIENYTNISVQISAWKAAGVEHQRDMTNYNKEEAKTDYIKAMDDLRDSAIAFGRGPSVNIDNQVYKDFTTIKEITKEVKRISADVHHRSNYRHFINAIKDPDLAPFLILHRTIDGDIEVHVMKDTRTGENIK